MVKVNYNSFTLRKNTKFFTEIINLNEKFKLFDFIIILSEKYGKDFKDLLFETDGKELRLKILVNGVSVENLDYLIYNKDIINIIPLITGG